MGVKPGIIYKANRIFEGEEKYVFVIKLGEILEIRR